MSLFSPENIFLMAIAFVWIIFAVIQDFRRREVANWWTFSLIVFILAYRTILSVKTGEYWWLWWGVIGLGVGFLVANIFYYARLFAGGDMKLMMALGTILPLGLSYQFNKEIFLLFIISFFIGGSVYGAGYTIFLAAGNRKQFSKKFKLYFNKFRSLILSLFIIFIIMLVADLIFHMWILFIIGLLLVITPLLIIYAKSIEECSLNKYVNIKDLTIGDWLVKDVKMGKDKVKPYWEGLGEEELKLIRKKMKGKVLVKQGIPFTPAFLIAFISILIFLFLGYSFLFIF